ncbi:alpha/beta hydrolase family protein [Nocardia aobensis]|uniref:alpha/beta hydrolase family protein n=1 Tax=Nocardia aobensis TaxID=257277 RepID=UPI00031A1B73|nr:alpha/beta fold hydrolase [Nocardia aobensis]
MTLVRYGTHPSQHGFLSVPDRPGLWPVAMVIHGGFWRTAYGADLTSDLAEDLSRHGFAAWNIEYRRVGEDPDRGGGGWPATCLDVAAAADLLAAINQSLEVGSLDLSRVVAIGHSAGGQLAGWLAGRGSLPAGSPGATPRVRLTGFVSQAGVLDLELALQEDLGSGAVRSFLGARADDPESCTPACPSALLPMSVPSICVHGTADDEVPLSQSQRFVAAARRAGDDSRLLVLPGVDHFALIDVASSAWAACRSAVLELAR